MFRIVTNIFKKNRTSDQDKIKKIGWSQRFFIFAAVMFLLGWASTGIMSSAKDGLDLGFFSPLQSRETNPREDVQTVSQENMDEADSTSLNLVTENLSIQPTENLAAIQQTSSEAPAAVSTEVPFVTGVEPEVDNPVNWGDWYCANCVAVPVRVRLTHYWPPLGGDNCWSFYDDYCYSPTKSTVPWESIIEISAACPVPWLGSVVEIPDLDRRYLCLDTGDKVICKDGTCVVDVLTDKIYPWDGLEFEAIVYYPKVWIEPAPTYTPTSSIDQ